MANKHSSSYYIDKARDAGLRVENGRGSHAKIYGPADRGYMVVPKGKDLSPGVEGNIRKWFMKLGIILAIVLFCYGCYLNQAAIAWAATQGW